MTRHTPRDYQSNLRRKTYDAWAAGARNVLAVMPTGAGKTFTFAEEIHDNDGPSCAIAHRKELVGQISLALARAEIRHRIIGQEHVVRLVNRIHTEELGRSYYHPQAQTAVASVDTLIRWMTKPAVQRWGQSVTLWVMDEAHHVLRDNKWGRATTLFPNARGLGVTATPCRADGKGLGRHADGIMDAMVIGPSLRQLIHQGYLTDYVIYAPLSDLDMSKESVGADGDYTRPGMKRAAKRSHIVGDVVAHYLRIAPGKLGVTFATDVETAGDIARQFNDNGVPAAVVSAETPDLERVQTIRRFRNRELLQLVNVDLFGEGFDLPAIEVVSMARPTKSFALFVQQAGRALRPMPGKNCIARDTLILTDKGLVRIQDVTLDHKVWDGVSFVCHSGAICKGVQKVINYQGLVATPDHKVMTTEGWVSLYEASNRQLRIVTTGIGGNPIRFNENNLKENSPKETPWGINSITRRGTMFQVRGDNNGSLQQSKTTTEQKRVSKLQRTTANGCTEMAVPTCSITTGPMYKSIKRPMEELRRTRDRIQVRISKCRGEMDNGQFKTEKKSSNRPKRQQWALRTRKFENNQFSNKYEQHKKTKDTQCSKSVCKISKAISRNSIRRHNLSKTYTNIFTRRNYRKIPPIFLQTEREVWDIHNAGPLQRFTAGGLLVHNCAIIIDHVGNTSPAAGHIRLVEENGRLVVDLCNRIWTLDRQDRRARSTPDDVIPTRTCLECFRVYEAVKRGCPYCGHIPVPAARSGPEFVDGDLTMLDADTLARLYGNIARIEAPVEEHLQTTGAGYLGAVVQRSVAARHREHQEALAELQESIGWWAAYEDWKGRPRDESYRRFWFKFGTDVLTAQGLRAAEMKELKLRIDRDVITG